ncbi:serine/threonine protein phosphatase [Aureimonas fodinaquatilis]|uniref:Serine/threonine protein phosphatase n=1 Tax=Aureimonas fodinaquatilis TaxID=2565783 RepID=A0A5B0E196_9HYPH|nr:metallophosphoesterase [Aureimonas fodinaquatilis]KAA0971741.1 serine/threonine protein phosphatase [Aureimonas fodinaquatilis]
MKNLSRSSPQSEEAPRNALKRIGLEHLDCVTYAIGDVHGCFDELRALEQQIIIDAANFPGDKLIIMLGDYVDRGPASSGVIDHLMQPPPQGFVRFCLAGNHELMMLDYLEGRVRLAEWLGYGGAQTLASYGVDVSQYDQTAAGQEALNVLVRKNIPLAHLQFLKSLAVFIEAPGYLFVHAGLMPNIPLEKQGDTLLTTIRSEFYSQSHLLDRLVVHGHTPVEQPIYEANRVNLDTGACLTGRLTGMRIWHHTGRFLSNRPGGLVRPALVASEQQS